MSPRSLTLVTVLAALVTVLAGIQTVGFLLDEWGEDGRQCEAAVDSRDEARTMFVWIGEAFPTADFTTELTVELNRRLPRLHCVDNQPVPVEDIP